MEKIVFKSKYCDLGIDSELESLHEIWKIANNPIDEFKRICYAILEECKNHQITTLIIDTSSAVSMLPREHQLWLSREFNRKILYETEVKTVILVSPESIVTKISTDQFYHDIAQAEHGILTFKIKSYAEAQRWLKAKKKMEESKKDAGYHQDNSN